MDITLAVHQVVITPGVIDSEIARLRNRLGGIWSVRAGDVAFALDSKFPQMTDAEHTLILTQAEERLYAARLQCGINS